MKTAIYLFDAAVLPILTYGSEIWALNATLDHAKWDKTHTEQAHLNFIKHILEVNRSTNNLICTAELGRYPLSIGINTRIINFYRHAKAMPVDSIPIIPARQKYKSRTCCYYIIPTHTKSWSCEQPRHSNHSKNK